MDTIEVTDEFGDKIGTIEIEDDLGEQKVSVEFSFTTSEEQTGAFRYEDLQKSISTLYEEYSS